MTHAEREVEVEGLGKFGKILAERNARPPREQKDGVDPYYTGEIKNLPRPGVKWRAFKGGVSRVTHTLFRRK